MCDVVDGIGVVVDGEIGMVIFVVWDLCGGIYEGYGFVVVFEFELF